ncbi:MAG: hypothetical protein SF066_14460 [Thermoanaerobaculia bacterium]|nr:hypothetical protein [Thermoanaerobaculia bacterium]
MFTLKIFFLGLIAFSPSPDGQELRVLLVDGRQGYTTSDGTEIGPHHAFLMATAGSCQNDCTPGDSSIADFFFGKYGSAAPGHLSEALVGGAVWRLSESEIELRTPQAVSGQPLVLTNSRSTGTPRSGLPAAPLEASDFSWIANLGQIAPDSGGLNLDHLEQPALTGWVIATLRLRNGRISAYRLAGVENQVIPIGFRALLRGATSNYSQALADSVMAEIEIEGDAVEIVEKSFDGATRKTLRLKPNAQGVVELALLNMPPVHNGHTHHTSTPNTTGLPDPGKHFELFYALTENPPAKTQRLVPHADTRAGVPWSQIYPRRQSDSTLLAALGLDDPRTILEAVLCPVVLIPPPR